MEKINKDTLWADIRNTRNLLLRDADNMVNAALDNGEDATRYRQYRKDLRDIPQTYTNPDEVIWPPKPAL